MTSCFNLITNYRDISYNKYIFNNNVTNISYGLYDNSNNNYLIKGVPSNYPLTFFSQQSNTISNIIKFEALNTEPIIIYVSRGQDVSLNNGDFFRFYDNSYQLLNINHRYRTIYDSSLTDVRSNFYFMNNRSYTFKTTQDFCSNFPFTISGNLLTTNNSLSSPDSSFTITIPPNADNSSNKLFYIDNDNDISGNLYILRDVSALKYYYGDISFSITNYNDASNIKLSLKSYDFSYGTSAGKFGNKEISNNDLFYYSSSCSYIINNNLLNNNEFLNKVSALDISYIDNYNPPKLSFNKGRHSTYTNNNPNNNPNIIYDLNFGLGKGSYIIIDVSSTFPIRLNNQDISNLIAIDTTYQPARIKDISYNNKTYYYGSFKINVFNDFSDVTIGLLNRKSLEELSYNSKFFYTQLPHLQGTSYGPIGTSYLKLKNQQSNYYDLSDSTLSYNKYDLNLDTSYKELSYIAADKYGHNLNILDFIRTIPSSEQTINQEISNNIMNGLFNYNILYKVIDYENNSIQNIRTVVINSGPIIEISSNYFQNNEIYKNNNQYNNILNFQNNTFNSNYNFFDNIKVYIYDTSRQRINIPFEVSISGDYINNNNSRNIQPLINDTSFSYTQNYGVTSIPYLADNSGKNYYAYYRNFVLFRNTGTDFITINNFSQTSLIIDNSGSKILSNNTNTIHIAPNVIAPNEITIGGTNNSIKLNSIEQRFDISTISLNFNSTYTRPQDPKSHTLNCSLKLNNYFFEISFNSPRFQDEDNCKITGYFKPINFFGNTTNNLIDVSYIGSYNLNISTKGLSNGDYFYDTSLIRNRFFNQNISNKSRTYTINIQDTISPVLTFYDKNTVSTSTTYLYTFPTTRTFNILQDICFVNLKNFNNYNTYVSNKPLIQYSDNSIYDFSYSRDISFTLIRGNNINYNHVTKEISSNSLVSDTSCVINYRAKDICANWSQDISLILYFIDVPYAELSGNAILTRYFSRNATYRDAGLLIYGINNSSISSAFIPNEISGNSIYELSRNIVVASLSYDICYNTDLCLNNVSTNDYSFNYIITISGSTRSLKLSRKIRVIDNNPPYFLFQDFSSINYTLNDARLGNNNATYNANYTPSSRRIYSNDTSFNIDFSLVVYRTFDDLSKVLYDFDVSDNYQQSANITKTLTFGNNPSPFTFNDISNYFDNSIPRRLNKVTKSKGQLALGQLQFKYTISGSYNTYSVTRNVDIINDKPPIIDFSFANYYSNTHSYQYVYFDTTFKDFSYVALDYNKPNSGYDFNQELSSILYNFDLSVNVNRKTDISYIITISNNIYKQIITTQSLTTQPLRNFFSIKDTSFSLIYDISDNQDNSFQIIRNVKIIDVSTNLDISFLNASSLLTISFGDTNFDILRDVSFNHNRLTTTSISFDISYNFQNSIPNTITSVSGSGLSLFDPSALIYRLGSNSVNYFPKAYPMSFYSKRRTITISNEGPLISFPSSSGISHEIYTPLSDASLIFGVTSKSIYDEFFFSNYKQGLSYNGTNFKVTFDNCLNIMEPSAGLYNVYYSSTDLCGITTRRSRLLDVADRRPPLITICGDFYYELVGNTYYIPTNSIYEEYGAYAYDAGTRTYDISITKFSEQNIITISNGIKDTSYVAISNEMLTSEPLIYKIDISNYRISYRANDRFNKSQTIIRNIFVTASKKPKLYPYIELSTSNGSVEEYILTSNVSINTRLINSTGIGAPFYDVSLSFNYDNNTEYNQNIICQAVQKNIFARDKSNNNNYIKFKLRATNANDVVLASSFVNVEYETIDSTIIAKTNKIYFYARDISQAPIDQISFLEYNLIFVDTIPPQVFFLNNRNFETNSNLNYPLLSAMSINDLSININSYANYNNLYNNYEYYYKKSLSNNIVLFDPGIKISDIVSGEVNYIDNSFVMVNGQTYNFISSDISINYYNVVNSTFIDICNILFQGHINDISQSYNVRDEQGNYSNTKSRTISVTRFPPFINLNYQKDCCSNNYITYYHNKFEKYLELKGKVVDYFDGFTLSFENVIINNKLNESVNGTYSIIYDVSNSANIYNNIERKVDVITTLPLIQHTNYHFNDILNFNYPTLTNIINKTYAKYSLYNGTYKFIVPPNLAFNIITREFDICNGIYAINNVVSITSDSSYNKFYFNNVTLTISGDFNRLSVELINNAIYSNIFVYDSKNTYIDLYEVLNNNENNVIIDSSYIVDISNLNNPNPNSSPYFAFASTTTRDLHLSIGNYRFYQYGYTNFHNPIKFSITKDGTHNGGIEYTKNIFRKNLPGVSILNRNPNSSYTQINIDATTPATLYYYCENFPNMGGQIQIKNNIIFSKQTIILNNYVIDADSKANIFNSAYYAAHNISNDVLKNRVLLTQRFRVSGGDLSFVNITCITQQNIQHNMLYNLKQEPHKLIIRKHIDLDYRPDISFTDSPYSVIQNNTNEYLVENKGSSYNFSNTYINLFKYDFNSALEVEKRTSDPQLDIYDEDIRPIFYNYKNYNFFQVGSNQLLDEINNYIDFFRTNKLLTKTLLAESFKYKLSDFFFAKSSKVLNLDNANEYNYNEQLLAPRIRITNITGNYVTFILDIYYNNSNNNSNNKEVLFGTYEYIVYSTSFINISNVINSPAIRDFITFYNGSLTITSNLIYSYKSELSNNFYDSRIFDDLSNSDLYNTVFLSIKDTSNNNASLCGLTKQNLYNNIYFDENQTLIFHKFGATSIVNYQVNTPALTLEHTLSESTNNDNYLIDICANDIYNFYNERPLNFNTLRDLSSNEEYNVYIAFAINDELASTNNYLTQFDIQPIYFNNMPIRRIGNIYRQYSQNSLNSYNDSINIINEISYNSIQNKLTSHSYVIDLNDYFDIKLFKNNLLATNSFSTDFVDINKLSYSLLDICFTIPFNLYDINASQSVIFNPINLNLLLTMRNRIIPLYYKLTYMIKVLAISFPNVPNNRVTLTFKESDNINYYINLITPDPSNLIADFYTNKVSIATLNNLFMEIFDNIQTLLFNFDTVINSYNIRHIYLVNISNFLNMVIDFNYINIDYLDNIITLLESNVENILTNMLIYLGENNITMILKLYNLTSNIVLANGNVLTNNDISYLDYCFKAFYTLNNELDLMRKEIAVRNYDYENIFESYEDEIASNSTNYMEKRYKNLYRGVNLDAVKLYSDLSYNFKLLNTNFILDYSYVLYNYANVNYYTSPFPKGTNNIVDYQPYNDASINNYETLYTNVNNLYNIITSVFNIVSSNYNIINKPTLYINTRYDFVGSKLLINSYYSNSIALKLNIIYKKSLYQSIDLSNIYLDITIPDVIPPTLIFNNNATISFNENILNSDASVNELVNTKLINDLSYIDLNQSYTITSASRKYYDDNPNVRANVIRPLSSSSNYSLSLLQIDFTDISNVIFNDVSAIYTYIKYVLLDNANNRNIINRKILLINDNTEPIFFYKAINTTWRAYGSSSTISTTSRPTLIVSQSITQEAFFTTLNEAIIIVDPLLHERYSDLFKLEYSDISLTILRKDASNIDLSYIKIVSEISNISVPIQTINNVQSITNFSNLMNNQLVIESSANNLFVEYFSSTNVYPRPGQLRIKLQIIPSIIIAETSITTHCCYPKVEYKPIQDNYKLGSQNTAVMRMAKYIINRHI